MKHSVMDPGLLLAEFDSTGNYKFVTTGDIGDEARAALRDSLTGPGWSIKVKNGKAVIKQR